MEQQMSAWAIPGVQIDFSYMNRVIARSYEVAPEDLRKPTRKNNIKEGRQLCMTLLYSYMRLSGRVTVRLYGLTNHATCLHSIKRISGLYKFDPKFRNRVNMILGSLNIQVAEFQQCLKVRSEVTRLIPGVPVN